MLFQQFTVTGNQVESNQDGKRTGYVIVLTEI